MVVFPEVLFVTNRDDFTIDYLIFKFKEKNIPYLRLNSEDITELSIQYDISSINIKYENIGYDFSNVKSIYFRRAPTVFPKSCDENDILFVNRERRNFFEGLYLSLNAKWINSIFSTYISERKLYQLNIAKKLDFKVPRTLVTNDPSEITSFLKTNKKNIIKPISYGLQVTKGNAYSIYTSEINNTDFIEKDKLIEAPVLIQEKIENYCDIRVTIVGRKIFAVEIHKLDKGEVDWRKPNIRKSYKEHFLPQGLNRQILKIHEYLNLLYSAMDFILTPDGEYYFLEINPAGEWVWLEKELGISISEQIIFELLNN